VGSLQASCRTGSVHSTNIRDKQGISILPEIWNNPPNTGLQPSITCPLGLGHVARIWPSSDCSPAASPGSPSFLWPSGDVVSASCLAYSHHRAEFPNSALCFCNPQKVFQVMEASLNQGDKIEVLGDSINI
jgi:hypothetical protein